MAGNSYEQTINGNDRGGDDGGWLGTDGMPERQVTGNIRGVGGKTGERGDGAEWRRSVKTGDIPVVSSFGGCGFSGGDGQGDGKRSGGGFALRGAKSNGI